MSEDTNPGAGMAIPVAGRLVNWAAEAEKAGARSVATARDYLSGMRSATAEFMDPSLENLKRTGRLVKNLAYASGRDELEFLTALATGLRRGYGDDEAIQKAAPAVADLAALVGGLGLSGEEAGRFVELARQSGAVENPDRMPAFLATALNTFRSTGREAFLAALEQGGSPPADESAGSAALKRFLGSWRANPLFHDARYRILTASEMANELEGSELRTAALRAQMEDYLGWLDARGEDSWENRGLRLEARSERRARQTALGRWQAIEANRSNDGQPGEDGRLARRRDALTQGGVNPVVGVPDQALNDVLRPGPGVSRPVTLAEVRESRRPPALVPPPASGNPSPASGQDTPLPKEPPPDDERRGPGEVPPQGPPGSGALAPGDGNDDAGMGDASLRSADPSDALVPVTPESEQRMRERLERGQAKGTVNYLDQRTIIGTGYIYLDGQRWPGQDPGRRGAGATLGE